MSKAYRMHVISGTHWDREWRYTAEQSKPRLVELVDSMMDTLEKHPSYKTYCLDGGLVVIEDYLTIRPENKERLTKLIKSGRVQLVNWYTLPEMFTVAPEALLRNIKLGQDMAAEYGGAMSSGYTATGYGQTSQLPQIYLGFGISNAIFYRGTNKHILQPLFLWEGVDGSRIHTLRTFDEVTRTNWFFYVHQPLVVGKPARDLSYSYDAAHLPVHMCDDILYERGFKLLREKASFRDDEQSLKAALDAIMNQAKPYAINNHILALNMEDNDAPFALLPEMIQALNGVSPDVEIVQDSLDDYIKAIISETKQKELPVHKGELRYTAVEEGFNGLLGATHSSRIKLKILNEQAETALIHLAEPLAAISAALGAEYPRTSLQRAWRHLLQNHAHDSICGAAVDQAHEDNLYNFSVSKMVGQEITARSVEQIFSRIETTEAFQPGDHTITIFNNLPFTRKKVMPVVIDLPKTGQVRGIADSCTGIGATSNEIEYFDVVDSKGLKVACEVLSKEDISIGVERELDTNGIKMPAVRRRMLLEVQVPSLGYSTYALRPRGPEYVAHPKTGPDRPLIARENGVLENGHLKVQINPNGTFSLWHKESGHLMENQHYYTDKGEIGNAHFSVEPLRNTTRLSLGCQAKITMVESNLLRGVYRIDLNLVIPAAAAVDGRDRLTEEKILPISTWLTLEKGLEYLKIRTRLFNSARDHKLQVHFPSGIKAAFAHAESAFAVEQRDIRWTETSDNFEKFYPYQPMQNFVDVSDGRIGLAVLNKGLREYEVRDDEARTIAITLLRTHRAYMTANSDMTPEELDKYPGQQSQGMLEYRYALYPHTGKWDMGGVLRAAYDHKVRLIGIQGVPHKGQGLPVTQSFFKVSPSDKLMLSAVKQSDYDQGLVLRLWNCSGQKFDALVETTLPVKSAALLRLNETVMHELVVDGGSVEFECDPHKIVTILLRMG